MSLRINILFFAALFALFSCEKHSEAICGEYETTSVAISLTGVNSTRSVSQAENVDRVYYEVWDESFTRRLIPADNKVVNYAPVEGCTANVQLQLLKDQKFNLIFWAQNSNCKVYSWSNLKNIAVDYAGFTSNVKDVYDAFYAVENIVSNGQPKEVKLYRPFAQLNFGTSTMETSVGPFTIESNSVIVSQVATSFNTLEGKANADSYVSNVAFNALQGGLVQQESENWKDLKIDGISYYWVAMNYLFVPSGDQATVKVDAVFNTSEGTVTHSISNVPLKRNYKTNIVGDLFTKGAELTIKVVPDFNRPDLKPEN